MPPRREQHNAAAVALTENADPVSPQIAQARAFVAKSARLNGRADEERLRDEVRGIVPRARGGACGAVAGYFALGPRAADKVTGGTSAARPVWTEVKWPFPIDQWGTGRAFACKAADCGAEVNLYLRAKLGSCNCTTGVAEDADLDRMSDFDLVGGEVSPLDAGRPDRGRLDEGSQPRLCAHRSQSARQVRDIGRLQRPLRHDRRNGRVPARPTGDDRARRHGISQQQDRAALGGDSPRDMSCPLAQIDFCARTRHRSRMKRFVVIGLLGGAVAVDLFGAAILPSVAPLALAQSYPSRPVNRDRAVSPGGNTDIMARALQEPKCQRR